MAFIVIAHYRARPGTELFEKYVDAGGFTAHTETPHFQKYLRGEVLPNLSHRSRHDLTDIRGRV
jgi:quinol monooxygenase YgiN